MRNVFANFVALLTRNAVAKRCVFADLYTCFIYSTKFMDAQRRTALIFVTQGVGCASCMCDWGITLGVDVHVHPFVWPYVRCSIIHSYIYLCS